MEFLQFIMLVVLVEAAWESTKLVWDDGKLNIDRIGPLSFALATSLVYRIDLILMAEISQHKTHLSTLIYTKTYRKKGVFK